MAQAADQSSDLIRLLSSLPRGKVGELATRLEHEKLKGADSEQADTVLSAIRNTLREIRPTRWPTPLRLFCSPFEVFLVDTRVIKQPGRIARTSIVPVWNYVSTCLMPERHNEFRIALTKALLNRDETTKASLLVDFYAEASAALNAQFQKCTDGELDRATLAKALGGEAIVADAQEMATLLQNHATIAMLNSQLPEKLDTISEQTLLEIRDTYDQIIKDNAAIGAYILTFVMNRLQRPWEVMGLARVVARQTQDTMISATDIGNAGELLISDLEALSDQITCARPDNFEATDLAEKLDRLAATSAGMVREMGIRRDGKWGARIQKLRADAAKTMDTLLNKATQEILAAFPLTRAPSHAKAPRKPDLIRPPDAAKVAQSERWAALIACVKSQAAPLGFHASHKAAFDQVADTFQSYTEALLSELRNNDQNSRAHASAYLEALVGVVTKLSGEEAAALLRRRTVAAQAA